MNGCDNENFLKDHAYTSQRLQWDWKPSDNPQTQLVEFYNRLGLKRGNYLVIWDDFYVPSYYLELVASLPSTKNICILVTCRNIGFCQKFAKDIGCIRLRDFSKSESMELVSARMSKSLADRSQTENAALEKIAETLCHLPFALTQVAAMMSRDDSSPQLILDSLGNPRSSSLFSDVVGMSFIELERRDKLAIRILSLLSFLHESHLPKYLLMNRYANLGTDVSTEDVDGSIASLQESALVQVHQDQSHISVYHSIQWFFRERLRQKAEFQEWEQAALRVIWDEFPEGELENGAKCNELLPHALKMLELEATSAGENFRPRYELLHNAGTYALSIRKYEDAKRFLQDAYLTSMKRCGIHSKECQCAAISLSELFIHLGRFVEAEQLISGVLKARTAALGAKHPDTVAVTNKLAAILGEQRKSNENRAETQRMNSEKSRPIMPHLIGL